jgi:hypothetical protein
MKEELVRIAEFEGHFSKTVGEVEALQAAMIPLRDGYSALVARAAHGDNVADAEWEVIETEILALARKAMRCFETLKYQQLEMAKINTEIAEQAAEQIAKTFCFFSPVSGNA